MNRKKLGITLGAVLLAVLVVVGALFATVWSKPGVKDFESAQADLQKLRDTSGPINKTYAAYFQAVNEASRKENASKQQIDAATADKKRELQAQIDIRNTQVKKLAESKVQRDEDIQKAFKSFQDKENKYMAYVAGYSAVYPTFRSSLITCQDIFEITKQIPEGDPEYLKKRVDLNKKETNECLADLKVLSASSFKPVANYATKFTSIANARQKTFEDVYGAKIEPPVGTEQIRKQAEDLKTLDPISAITAAQKEASFDGEIKALEEALKREITERQN